MVSQNDSPSRPSHRWVTPSVAAAVIAALSVALPALAATGSAGQMGYDVSYPQCTGSTMGSAPITAGAFDILGANGGLTYAANPCLAAEYSWASGGRAVVSFYANTGNPGPQSAHWPVGQQIPEVCPVLKHYRPGTSAFDACSYDYGYDAAEDSFTDVQTATSSSIGQAAPWWLDIESANSWTRSTEANNADIQGALAYFQQNTSARYVGIYTNSSSWSSITGSTERFRSYPFWAPGATLATAAAACGSSSASVTGGHIRYAQYQVGNFDDDYDCG